MKEASLVLPKEGLVNESLCGVVEFCNEPQSSMVDSI